MCSTRQRSKAIEFEKYLNNKQMTKDCFERFGDDLTEFVLSFLTINDKLKYETVSKQWKSLLFNKQRKLDLYFRPFLNPWLESNNHFINNLFNNKNELKPKAFKGLLKKFPFINELYFSSKINSKILNIITNNCKHLEKMTINRRGFDDCSEKSVQRFGQKLGQKLKIICLSQTTLDPENHQKFRIIFDFSPNIEAFYYNKISIITSKPNNYYSKLKKINVYIDSFTVNDFIKFADFYYKQINEIDLRSNSDEMFDKRLFNQLSRFENLNVLSLEFIDNELSVDDIENGLSMIGNECKKLQKIFIGIEMTEHSKLISINKIFFKIINSFQSITNCKINIYYIENDIPEQFDTNDINNESLICMKNIKHLELDIDILSDNHFKHLNKFMPNLKTFKMSASYNNCITDETLSVLAKIEGLTDIVIRKFAVKSESMNEITDEGVIDIIEKCKQIKSIIISDKRSVITPKTIDAVLGLKLKPKITYYYQFSDNIGGELRKYIKSIEKDFSENLKIESH